MATIRAKVRTVDLAAKEQLSQKLLAEIEAAETPNGNGSSPFMAQEDDCAWSKASCTILTDTAKSATAQR